MKRARTFVLVVSLVVLLANATHATQIREVLVPPDNPGNAYTGTFYITPSMTTWAFGVGNDLIQDTAISGISSIDGLSARDHWISALIAKESWELGFDFDSIRPIGATPPSSFSIDTTEVDWLWGDSTSVAFYWLSEAGPDPDNPQAVLQPGTEYDAFKFFTSGPNSPFAAFSAPNGGTIITGETRTTIIPEPSTLILVALGGLGIVFARRRQRSR
ncbi:PEP-CTERM sorting domain-containing protein [Tautonia rosea]|uniref:PEP-CTERM sorting domain-containing protein n=1 Tax=Tautonia rosea TaxID=2728037 RepID=UPI0014751DDA|nr:PEP-CTERM sorting domain-containing protein [Tautonia rosea]